MPIAIFNLDARSTLAHRLRCDAELLRAKLESLARFLICGQHKVELEKLELASLREVTLADLSVVRNLLQ